METTLKNQHQRVPLNLECKKIPSLLGFAKRRGASGDKSQCKPGPAAVSGICLPARGVWYTPVIMVAYYQTHSVHISFIIFCHFGPIVFFKVGCTGTSLSLSHYLEPLCPSPYRGIKWALLSTDHEFRSCITNTRYLPISDYSPIVWRQTIASEGPSRTRTLLLPNVADCKHL